MEMLANERILNFSLHQGHVLYFGPTYCCQRYLQDQGGFLDTRLYSANPADFIVAVALHLRDNSEQCPKHLSDYAKLARDYTVQSYPDDFKCYNTADDKNHVLATALDRRAAQLDTSSLQSTLQRMVGSIKADFHDVQKSPVILRVLLSREFLKEKRRYRFWLTVMLRAIVLGVIIGTVCSRFIGICFLYGANGSLSEYMQVPCGVIKPRRWIY